MQRLGYLKYLIFQAAKSSTNNISNLGNELLAKVTQSMSLPLNSNIADYIQHTLTDPSHKEMRLAAKRANQYAQLEMQDYYLAYPSLPSRRGRLVNDDANRYPLLAADLNLLQRGSCTVQARGQILIQFLSDDERRAFDPSFFPTHYLTFSPFMLTLQQKLVLLFSIIESDGDLLKYLFGELIKGVSTFALQEAGNRLPDIYRLLAKEGRVIARSGDDLLKIQRLLDIADNIEAVKRNPSPGGKNAREHAITLRLESFVDLGLLSKSDPYSNQYMLNNNAITFFDRLLRAKNIDTFLKTSFFGAINSALGINAVHCVGRKNILPVVQQAYRNLKSPIGYASIAETCLLGGIYYMANFGSYFEIEEAIDELKSLQKERPDYIRFNVDQWGSLSFIKISEINDK
jgi:hypothetical protein